MSANSIHGGGIPEIRPRIAENDPAGVAVPPRPAEAAARTTAPHEGRRLADARPRIAALLEKAVKDAGGILLVDRFDIGGTLAAAKEIGVAVRKSPAYAAGAADIEKTVKQIGDAMRGLDAVDGRRFSGSPLDKEVEFRMQELFAALGDLSRKAEAFAARFGESAVLEDVQNACTLRMCEMSRFLGTIQAMSLSTEERARDHLENVDEIVVEGRKASDVMRELALTMHGNDRLLSRVAEETDALRRAFGEAKNRADASPGAVLPSGEKAGIAWDLLRRIDALGVSVKDASNPGKNGGLAAADRDLMQVLGAFTNGVRGWLLSTLDSPQSFLQPLVTGLFPIVDDGLLDRCAGLPDSLRRELRLVNKRIEEIRKPLQDKANAGKLTRDDVEKSRAEFDKMMQTPRFLALSQAMQALDAMVLKPGDLNRFRLIGELRATGHTLLAKPEHRELAEKVLAWHDVFSNFNYQAEIVNETNAMLYTDLVGAARRSYLTTDTIDESGRFVIGQLNDQRYFLACRDELLLAMESSRWGVDMQRYLPMLWQGEVSYSTLMEAAIRNVPADHLEVRAAPGRLKKEVVLGAGAVNRVTLCTFDHPAGEVDLVFKPELEARVGLSRLALMRIGYRPQSRVAQLNIAAHLTARRLGCPEVVAASSVGVHKGEFGLFMERAPGASPRSLAARPAVWDKTMSEAEKNDAKARMLGNLQRELNNLAWTDLLTGQLDRHHDNYLTSFDPATGGVRVTGIDNDACFGEHLIGLNTLDLSASHPEQAAKLLKNGLNGSKLAATGEKLATGIPGYESLEKTNHPGLYLAGKKLIVRFHELTPRDLLTIKYATGINQAFLPTQIDEQTCRRLLDIQPRDYRFSLERLLGKPAADSAMQRLVEAQKYASELVKSGGVVKGDEWNTPATFEKSMKTVEGFERYRDQIEGAIRHEFFARDFAGLLGVKVD